jgi:hypothetical protein
MAASNFRSRLYDITVIKDTLGLVFNNATNSIKVTGEFTSDISGQKVDISGQTVNVSGQSLNVVNTVSITGTVATSISGQTVTISGQKVDISEQTVDISGQTVTISGQKVTISGQKVDISGQLVNAMCYGTSGTADYKLNTDSTGKLITLARNFDANGNQISSTVGVSSKRGLDVNIVNSTAISVTGSVDANISGQIVNVSGQTVVVGGSVDANISGQTVNVSGQTVVVGGSVDANISGQTVNVSGQTVVVGGSVDANISGQIVNVSGQTVVVGGSVDANISGQIVNVSGQTVNVSGQTVVVGGSVDANISGQTVNVSGQTVVVGGSVDANISGQTVVVGGSVDANISGQKVDISGQTLNISNTVSITGTVDTNIEGQTVNISGQTIYVGNISEVATELTLSGIKAKTDPLTFDNYNDLDHLYVYDVRSKTILETIEVSVSGIKAKTDPLTFDNYNEIDHLYVYDVRSKSVLDTINTNTGVLNGVTKDEDKLNVNVSGQTVNVSGQTVVVGGSVDANISGQTVNVSGQTVVVGGSVDANISGQIVNVSGQTVVVGGSVDANISGQTVVVGGSVDANISGQKVDISGQILNIGNTVSITGTVATDISGQTVVVGGSVDANISGQKVDISGQILNIGNTVSITGTVATDISGQTVVVGGSVDANISGQKVDISGQTLNIGNTVSITGTFDSNISGQTVIIGNTVSVTGSFSSDISGQTVVVGNAVDVYVQNHSFAQDSLGRLNLLVVDENARVVLNDIKTNADQLNVTVYDWLNQGPSLWTGSNPMSQFTYGIDANLREGWYYSNSENVANVSNVKWYNNVDPSGSLLETPFSKGDLTSVYAIVTLDSMFAPTLSIFSLPTGVDDIIENVAHSRWDYQMSVADTGKIKIGETVMLYIGNRPTFYDNVPGYAYELASTTGDGANNETISRISINTPALDGGLFKYLLQYTGYYTSNGRSRRYMFKNSFERLGQHSLVKLYDLLDVQSNEKLATENTLNAIRGKTNSLSFYNDTVSYLNVHVSGQTVNIGNPVSVTGSVSSDISGQTVLIGNTVSVTGAFSSDISGQTIIVGNNVSVSGATFNATRLTVYDASATSLLTTIESDISGGVVSKGKDDVGTAYPMYTDSNGVQRVEIIPGHQESSKYVFETDAAVIGSSSGAGWSIDVRGRYGWYYNAVPVSTLKWYGNNGISSPPALEFNKMQTLYMIAALDSTALLPKIQVITSASVWEYILPAATSIINGETYLFYLGNKAISLHPSYHPLAMTETLVSGPGANNETITEINVVTTTSGTNGSMFLLQATGIWNQNLAQRFEVIFGNVRDFTAETNLGKLNFSGTSLNTVVTNLPSVQTVTVSGAVTTSTNISGQYVNVIGATFNGTMLQTIDTSLNATLTALSNKQVISPQGSRGNFSASAYPWATILGWGESDTFTTSNIYGVDCVFCYSDATPAATGDIVILGSVALPALEPVGGPNTTWEMIGLLTPIVKYDNAGNAIGRWCTTRINISPFNYIAVRNPSATTLTQVVISIYSGKPSGVP